MQQSSESLSPQQLLDVMSRSIDSSVNKKGLIIANEEAVNNKYEDGLMNSFVDSNPKAYRKEKCKESYLDAIKQLNIGPSDEVINKYVDENLEIPANYSESLKLIPLHGLIDIAKAFLTQGSEKLSTALDNINLSDPELKHNIGEFIKTRYGIDNCNYDFKPKDELASVIFNLIKHIKDKSNDIEYVHSVERNYTADKKLNADIMPIDGVQDFCNYYRMISCFADSKNQIQHMGVVKIRPTGSKVWVDETRVLSTSIQNSERNIEILFNMFKAKLIGNFVADKKMGIGVNDVDLEKVVCITEGLTDLVDPAYELQVLGRGGRGNQKGTYFFYRYTDSKLYFDFNDVATLEGEALKDKFEQARQSYLEDKQANIERRSVAIFDKIRDTLSHQDICFSDIRKTHGEFSVEEAKKWCLKEVNQVLVDEFNDLNMQCGFNKDITVEIFIKILQKIIETEENHVGAFKDTYQEKARHRLGHGVMAFASMVFCKLYGGVENSQGVDLINQIINSINTEKISIIKNAIKDLKSKTKDPNSYWSCVAHAPIMTQEEIVNSGDPNSDAPIFMEQKERLQQQNILIHHASESMKPPSTTGPKVSLGPKQTSTGSQQTVDFSNPATQNKPIQQTSAKKKVMYGMMIVSPFLAVGTYALVVGTAAFNPIIAAGIFIGVVLAALALFGTMKVYEKKKENSDMEVGTAFKGASLDLVTPWSNHRTGCEAG